MNNKIIEECIKGNEEKCEFYEKLKEKLQKIYNSMPDKD